MTRRALILLAATAAFSVSLSAGAAFGAKPRPVKEWASGVCGELVIWKAQVVKLGQTNDPADAPAGKRAIKKLFSGALQATDELAEQLESLGAPKTDNGDAIAAALTDGVDALRSAYASAESAAAALPTTDAAVFAAAAAEIAAQVEAASEQLRTSLAGAITSTSKQLDRAFEKTKVCRAIT